MPIWCRRRNADIITYAMAQYPNRLNVAEMASFKLIDMNLKKNAIVAAMPHKSVMKMVAAHKI